MIVDFNLSRGQGYNDYLGMSNNAVSAIEQGILPIHFWESKKFYFKNQFYFVEDEIANYIYNLGLDEETEETIIDEVIKDYNYMSFELFKNKWLVYSEWHHMNNSEQQSSYKEIYLDGWGNEISEEEYYRVENEIERLDWLDNKTEFEWIELKKLQDLEYHMAEEDEYKYTVEVDFYKLNI